MMLFVVLLNGVNCCCCVFCCVLLFLLFGVVVDAVVAVGSYCSLLFVVGCSGLLYVFGVVGLVVCWCCCCVLLLCDVRCQVLLSVAADTCK